MSFHLHLDLSNYFFSPDFPIGIMIAFLIYLTCAICPAHSCILIWSKVLLWNSWCKFPTFYWALALNIFRTGAGTRHCFHSVKRLVLQFTFLTFLCRNNKYSINEKPPQKDSNCSKRTDRLPRQLCFVGYVGYLYVCLYVYVYIHTAEERNGLEHEK